MCCTVAIPPQKILPQCSPMACSHAHMLLICVLHRGKEALSLSSPSLATRMAASIDSPAWTFGLNPKVPGPRVPGPGTYNVAGSLDGGSAGTFFSPIGTKPTCPRTDARRLVFGIGVCRCVRSHDFCAKLVKLLCKTVVETSLHRFLPYEQASLIHVLRPSTESRL